MLFCFRVVLIKQWSSLKINDEIDRHVAFTACRRLALQVFGINFVL